MNIITRAVTSCHDYLKMYCKPREMFGNIQKEQARLTSKSAQLFGLKKFKENTNIHSWYHQQDPGLSHGKFEKK